jgi:hypothetical protein
MHYDDLGWHKNEEAKKISIFAHELQITVILKTPSQTTPTYPTKKRHPTEMSRSLLGVMI